MSDDEIERQLAQLSRDRAALQLRVEEIESILSTAATPLWKRVVFRLDGWGPWWQNRAEPKGRPWHPWWVS
jgi:hypothetical protein